MEHSATEYCGSNETSGLQISKQRDLTFWTDLPKNA